MRIAGLLAAGAVVAWMTIAGGVTVPAARAATGVTPAAGVTQAAGSASGSVLSRWAGAGERGDRRRPLVPVVGAGAADGSVAEVITAYVVRTTPGLNLNRVITVPGGSSATPRTGTRSTSSTRGNPSRTAAPSPTPACPP